MGQAEMVNVAGVCSPSNNDVEHHENASTETGHISPWVKPRQGLTDEEKRAAWLQRPCTTEHTGTKTAVGARTSSSSCAKAYGHSKWKGVQRLKTRAEELGNRQEASADDKVRSNYYKKVRATYARKHGFALHSDHLTQETVIFHP